MNNRSRLPCFLTGVVFRSRFGFHDNLENINNRNLFSLSLEKVFRFWDDPSIDEEKREYKEFVR